MRIMYLARRPIPSVNANSVQIVKMCEAFSKLGHEVTLVCHRGDDEPGSTFQRYGVASSFRIEAFPRHGRLLKKWRYLLRLVTTTSRRDADVLFGRDIWSLSALAHLGRPLIYEAHIIPPAGSARHRLLSRLFAQPNFAHLVCVTSTLAEMYRKQFPSLSAKPVIVAPNAGAAMIEMDSAHRWPFAADRLQVGFVGRPFPGKGIEMLIEAARKLAEVDFHIVGASRAELEWIDCEVPSNVHFHGYQPHASLGRYYRRFDVAAAPYGSSVMNASGIESAAITSPLKLIEYMAAGLPTIVSDLPGVRDIVANGEVAIVVPPGDLDAFVGAVRRLEDPELRRRMGASALEQYLERHTAEARAGAVLGDVALETEQQQKAS